LRGRSLFYQRVSLDEAIRELRRAVALDADFAQAWAFLGAAEYVTGQGGYPTEMDQARLMQRAGESIERALALDDAIPIAQAAQGQLLVDSDDGERIASGLALLKDAAAAVSPDSTPKIWYGISLLQLGDIERAFEVFEQAHSQDPLVAINNGYLGVAHAMQGRRDEGARYALRALELSGELSFWVWLIVIDAANAGDIEQAAGLMSKVADSLPENDAGISVIPMLIEALGQGTPYSDWLERDLSAPERLDASNGVGNTAMDALILRDLPAAIEAARQSQWVIRFQLIMSAWMPSLLELREDPAFFNLMTDTGYVDYWRATRFPLGCRPIDEGGVARLECGETP
jgi:tetratricopeptide (TPR) repeat protein